MGVCCNLLNCFGASSPRRSLLDIQEHETVEEVVHPALNIYPNGPEITPEIVKASLHGLNLTNKPKLVSICLMLHKLSSQDDDVDIDVEFANQRISGYYARDEGKCTVISILYNGQSIECSCLHLDKFGGMMKNRLIGEKEVNMEHRSDDIVNKKVENLENFYLNSLGDCSSHATTGGKSKSTFMQTSNGFFITKEIKEKEYLSFEIFGGELLDHISVGPTCFNFPWGVYKVVVNGETSHCLVTDKLRIPQSTNNLNLFDLKGIQGRQTQGPTSTLLTSTLLDADFADEMLRSGFSLSRDDMNTLIKSVERDTNFLQRVNVMDYSLLVGWDKSQRKIVYGIIDYLVQFDYLKKLEFASNSVRWNLHLRSLPPTVIPPIAYAKRLRGFVRQNFRTIRATNEGERSPE